MRWQLAVLVSQIFIVAWEGAPLIFMTKPRNHKHMDPARCWAMAKYAKYSKRCAAPFSVEENASKNNSSPTPRLRLARDCILLDYIFFLIIFPRACRLDLECWPSLGD